MREIKGTKYIFAILASIAIIGLLVISSAERAKSEGALANIANGKTKLLIWTNTNGGDHDGVDWTPADGTEIAGNHTNINTFTITAGTTVHIKAYDGTNYGNISIQARNIYINGTLNGTGRGYKGGTGGVSKEYSGLMFAGAGGGGGAYGNVSCSGLNGDSGPTSYDLGGGNGGDGGQNSDGLDGTYPVYPPTHGGAGRDAFGSYNDYTIYMGAGGGGGGGMRSKGPGGLGGAGGRGGGVIRLFAEELTVKDILAVNGTDGYVGYAYGYDNGILYTAGGGGGGSGGGILITARNATISGRIYAKGGKGGITSPAVDASDRSYGGNGSGGRIKIFYGNLITTGATISTNGHESGTIYMKDVYPPQTTASITSGVLGGNNWYISDVTINLTATDGSGVNCIEYKEGDGEWVTYTGSFTVATQGNITIFYRSVDNAGNVEDTKSTGFKIDKTLPESQVYLINLVASYITGVPFTVTWGGTDTTSGIQHYDVEYKVGLGSSWQSLAYHTTDTSMSFSALSEGQTAYFRCRAMDIAGNIEPWPISTEGDVNVSLDSAPPTTSHSLSGSMGSNSWYISNVAVTLSASDIVSGVNYTEYRINDGTWSICTDTFTLIDDGTHIVYCRSVDKAGNTECTKSVTIKIDKTGPVTTHSLSGTMGNNEWFVSSVEVSLSAADCTSGIDIIKYSWDTIFYTYSPSSKPSKDADGIYTIFYYAVDSAGNQGTINSLSFKIDKTAPTTSHSVTGTLGNSGWYTSNITIILTGTDTSSGLSHTDYQINNGVTQAGTSIALTQSGTYTVKYWSIDSAGNSEQDSSITIKIDKDKPVVSLSSPAEGAIVTTNTPALSWSGSDDDSGISYYKVQVDNNDNFASPEFTKTTTYTVTDTTVLPDNTYYWRVMAVDNAGNIGDWGGSTFVISTGPPTDLSIKINNGAQFTNSTYVSLILDASQNAYEMCFSNNNVSWFAWEPFATTKTWLLTASDGEKKVYFKCRNLYGNESEVVSDTIILDIISPTTTDDVPSGWQVVKPITVTLNATDNTSGIAYTYYKLWLAGTTEPDWSEGVEAMIIAEGVWYVKYYSVDVAGNAEINKSKEVWIDTAPPTTTDNIPSDWVNTTVAVNLTPTDATSGVAHTYYKFWVTANAEPSEYTEGAVILVSADGKWYIKYYSKDVANNSETPKQKELWLDTTPPSLQITEPQDGLITNKENITVKGAIHDLNGIESTDILVNDSSYFIALVDGNFSQTVILFNGTNTIVLKAKDSAQNWAGLSITIIYDPTIPTLVIYTPTNNSTTNISQCIVSGKTEPEYAITIDGMSISVNDTGGFAGTVILTEGLNIISVTATNPAGTKTTVFVYIILDTIAPITTHDIAGSLGSNNWYVSNVAITLNATDSTTAIIQTRYRINNGSWLNYIAPVVIITDGVCHTIEYYSVDAVGNAETVKSFYFGIDKTPPITIHDLIGTEGANGWCNSTITLILTANDGTSNIASIKYRENNGSWLDYVPTPIFSDGEYFIEYYSVDCAGNHEMSKSTIFKIDMVPPEAPKNITTSPTAWTNINFFSIDWNNTNDTAGIEGAWYKIGSQPTYNQDGKFVYQKPLVVSAPADGSYTVYVWLQDKAGNVNYQLSAIADIRLDTTIPQTTLLKTGASGNENWYISEIKIEFSVLDSGSGLKATYYSFKNSEYQFYTSAFNITEDGIYSIRYYSIDNAGNTELETTIDIKIDKKNPTTNATKEGISGNTDWFTSNVTIVLKIYDETSGVAVCRWSINNTNYQLYDTPIILSQDGVYTIRYYGTDTAGNIELEKELFVKIDKTPPTTTVSIQGLPGNDDWYVTLLTFSLISQDAVSGIKKIEYKINQGIWEEYTCPITFQDGIYTINYFAVNNADTHEKLQSIVVKVDCTAPITNISAGRYSVKSGEVLFTNSTIKFSAEDNMSGVREIKYCINNSVWRSYCEPIFLEEGIYAIQYYSIDFAGNTEYSTTGTIIIGEKILVPTIKITCPVENAELHDNVSVSYTAYSILNKTLFVTVKFLCTTEEIIIAENIAPEDEVKISTTRMENGFYTLRIIAVDSDGRRGYKEINVSLNNKMILEISVPNDILPESVIQITAEICNYLHSDECFAVEFYFDDLYIGCNQTSALKIFEKEKLSLCYRINSTTEHCVSVKLFTKNRQLLEEKRIYFAVAGVAEEESNKQTGFNFLQFSIPVFMCACLGILYISQKRKISLRKVLRPKRTSPSCSNTGQLPYSGNPLKSPEEVRRMMAEYKNKLRGEKNE